MKKGEDMTDDASTMESERSTTHRSNPAAEFLGVGIAIALMGGLLCLDPTEASQARAKALPVPAPAASIDAAGYEALRDAIAADTTIAGDVRRAMTDGRIDVVEMEALAPGALRTPTSMTERAARTDMLNTLEDAEKTR